MCKYSAKFIKLTFSKDVLPLILAGWCIFTFRLNFATDYTYQPAPISELQLRQIPVSKQGDGYMWGKW